MRVGGTYSEAPGTREDAADAQHHRGKPLNATPGYVRYRMQLQSPEHEFPVETPIPVDKIQTDRATLAPKGVECVVIRPRDEDGYHPVEFRDGQTEVLREGSRSPAIIADAYDADEDTYRVEVSD